MPKYWERQNVSLVSFPEVGQKQKTEDKEEERLKVGNNYGQLRIANAKPPGPKYMPSCLVYHKLYFYQMPNFSMQLTVLLCVYVTPPYYKPILPHYVVTPIYHHVLHPHIAT